MITLNTEPGSYVFETAVFFHIFCNSVLFAEEESESHFADNVSLGGKGVFKS